MPLSDLLFPKIPETVVCAYTGKVRIALVPSSLKNCFFRSRNKINGIRKYRIIENKLKTFRQAYLDKISFVLEKYDDVDLIAFGEYCFPADKNTKKNQKFIKRIQEISNETKTIIFGGSYQDFSRNNYNVTLVFVPWRTKPHRIIKWNIAANVNETASGAKRRQLKFIHTPAGFASAVTCLDIDDRNFIEKAALLNAEKKALTLDLIINPSRDESLKLRKSVRYASFRIGAFILQVNDHDYGPPYVCLGHKEVDHNIIHEEFRPPIYIYELCMEELLQNRKEMYGKKIEIKEI